MGELTYARKHVESDEQVIEHIKDAMLKQKAELEQVKAENAKLHQLSSEKPKTHPTHKTVTDAIQKMKKYDDYIQQNRDKLIDEEYKKTYSEELDAVKARNQKIMSLFNI